MAKIIPLSEGYFTVGHDKMFLPFDKERDELNERSQGSLLVEIQPFLVVTGKDVIVLDTGLGYKNEKGILQIHANLARHGYMPGDVTKVLLSHLHKDHVGGVVYTNDDRVVNTTFPAAEYYIYRAEADEALRKGAPSYNTQVLEPLLSSSQVKWLDGETGLIDGYIRFTRSGGHSPYHIVFLIEDGTDKIFYGGDEAPQLKQMKIRYIARYDFDGRKAMQLRQQYAEQGRAEAWTFLFYHDVTIPVAKL